MDHALSRWRRQAVVPHRGVGEALRCVHREFDRAGVSPLSCLLVATVAGRSVTGKPRSRHRTEPQCYTTGRSRVLAISKTATFFRSPRPVLPHVRPITITAALFTSLFAHSVCVSALPAQSLPSSLPSPQQAAVMLRARPELAAQLRQRLQTSGLSPAQVRTRLTAAGYPESLLDQVMGAASKIGRAHV